MKMNKNHQMILNSQDIISGWLSGRSASSVIVDELNEINIYNDWCNKYDMPTLKADIPDESDNLVEKSTSIDKWNMPEEYKNMDIAKYLQDKCQTKEELARYFEEYTEFSKRGMIPVLKFLVYLVDICEKNDIVLGVGRGSSVASYILYLIGIHQIDSIKYNLDIKEFLK